ncbi:MAG: hypothetical protein IPJ40_23960 [Saprospirales bacterium]|nr:hypothetical protein [Saprospirales bacterium]
MTFTGPAPYSLSYDDGAGIQTVNGINANPYTITVTPIATTTYCLTGLSNANCVGTVSGCATVTVNQEVSVANVGTACNSTNTEFVVSFEITRRRCGDVYGIATGIGDDHAGQSGGVLSNPIAAGARMPSR